MEHVAGVGLHLKDADGRVGREGVRLEAVGSRRKRRRREDAGRGDGQGGVQDGRAPGVGDDHMDLAARVPSRRPRDGSVSGEHGSRGADAHSSKRRFARDHPAAHSRPEATVVLHRLAVAERPPPEAPGERHSRPVVAVAAEDQDRPGLSRPAPASLQHHASALVQQRHDPAQRRKTSEGEAAQVPGDGRRRHTAHVPFALLGVAGRHASGRRPGAVRGEDDDPPRTRRGAAQEPLDGSVHPHRHHDLGAPQQPGQPRFVHRVASGRSVGRHRLEAVGARAQIAPYGQPGHLGEHGQEEARLPPRRERRQKHPRFLGAHVHDPDPFVVQREGVRML